jgi:hypothetical protein
MNMIMFPLVFLVALVAFLPGQAAAQMSQGRCFCIKYRPDQVPPYYIARFTPPPAGCADMKYQSNGKSPADNGLRSCDAASGTKARGAANAGGFSRDRAYGYALKKDGKGLREYLAPFFDKGELPAADFIFGIKGGYRSLGRSGESASGISSILASKNVGGKMVFAETFGLSDERPDWFKTIAARIDDGHATWGGASFSKKELVCNIRFSSGETYTIQVRRYGKDLVTRQTTRYKGETQVDYGFYYMDLGRVVSAGN